MKKNTNFPIRPLVPFHTKSVMNLSKYPQKKKDMLPVEFEEEPKKKTNVKT